MCGALTWSQLILSASSLGAFSGPGELLGPRDIE